MRLSDYLSTASKNIRRQKLRSALTITALAISTTILVTLVAMSIGARQAVMREFSPDGGLNDIIVTANRASASSLFGSAQEAAPSMHMLNDSDSDQLKAIPHVQAVSAVANIWEFNQFRIEGSDKAFVAQAQGVTPNAAIEKPLAAGTHFTADDTRKVAIIGYNYAKALGYANDPQRLIGKKVIITTQKGYRGDGAAIPGPTATRQQLEQFAATSTELTAEIIGVSSEGTTENSLLVPMGWARQLRTLRGWEANAAKAAAAQYIANPAPEQLADLKRVDQIATQGYTSLIVRADTTAAVRGISETIDRLGFGQVSTLDQVNRLMQFSIVVWVVLGAVSVIALITASLGVVNTMLMAANEQRYMIGVLRTCGARQSTIARLFLVEAGLLGFIGATIGLALGLVATWFVDQHVVALLKAQNLAVVHVATTPWWLLAGGLVVPILFGVISGLYPAYRAAREDPARILASV